jgi:carbon-monoxide dehydrogenase medium subunit
MMKLRFAQPEHLIDINRIPELRGICEDGNTVVIGAMTVENDLINSPILQAKVPLLSEAAKLIADPQVRNRGTIGGDIAHGDPGNDHPALSLVCDAEFVLEGSKGRRTVAANGFFLGTYMTLLEENEVMVAIRVPAFAKGTGSAYEKLKRKTGDWATAGCAVVIRKSGDQVSHVRIGLTNVAPTALRAEAAEAALLNKPFNAANVQAAVDAAIAICDPAEDLRGDVEYKTAMAGAMVKRALNKAWAQCS